MISYIIFGCNAKPRKYDYQYKYPTNNFFKLRKCYFLLMEILVYYAIILPFMEGSDNIIVNCLFNMIIVLAILLFLLNKTKIKKKV